MRQGTGYAYDLPYEAIVTAKCDNCHRRVDKIVILKLSVSIMLFPHIPIRYIYIQDNQKVYQPLENGVCRECMDSKLSNSRSKIKEIPYTKSEP